RRGVSYRPAVPGRAGAAESQGVAILGGLRRGALGWWGASRYGWPTSAAMPGRLAWRTPDAPPHPAPTRLRAARPGAAAPAAARRAPASARYAPPGCLAPSGEPETAGPAPRRR